MDKFKFIKGKYIKDGRQVIMAKVWWLNDWYYEVGIQWENYDEVLRHQCEKTIIAKFNQIINKPDDFIF
jgi:hypothetical protein